LLLLSIALMALSIRYQLAMFQLSEQADRYIGGTVLAAANIVLTTLLLSELYSIKSFGYIVAQLIITAISYVFMHRQKHDAAGVATEERHNRQLSDHNGITSIVISVFLTAIVCAAAINLFLAIHVPPNNFDSMTYHLARIGYWLQNQSLNHFYTHDMRQTYSAPNAEILILWPMLFLKSDLLANVIQWLAYCGTGLLVYRTAQLLGFEKRAALFSALVYLSLPMVVLQSTSTQNDLVATFFCLAGFYFFHKGVRCGNKPELVLSAIACGLALGTKGTFFFIAPALVVGSVFLVVLFKAKPLLYARWFGYCLVAMLLLGSYNYIKNYREFGSPLAPKSELFRKVEKRDVVSVLKNATSYGFMAAEFRGFPEALTSQLDRLKNDFGKRHLASFLTGTQFESIIAGNSSLIYHEDHGWFGFTGFFILLPIALLLLVKSSPLVRADEKWPYAFAAIFFYLFFCYMESYTPFKGRYFVLTFAFIAPLSASILQLRQTWLRNTIIVLVTACSVTSLYGATFNNVRKPVFAGMNVFNSSFYEQRAVWGSSPGMIPFMKFIDEVTVPGNRIGCVMRGDAWIYPFFGRDLSRVVLPIRPDEFDSYTNPLKNLYYITAGERKVMDRHNLDFLVLPIAEQEIAKCPDPVFEHNYTIKHVRVVSRASWERIIARVSKQEAFPDSTQLRKYYDIFSGAKNANVPLLLLQKELEGVSGSR